MKYISDIKVNGERMAFIKCHRPMPNTAIITHDIDTKVTEKVNDFPIDDCYGFSPSPDDSNYVIVYHTAQAVKLYKYIKLSKLAKNKLDLHMMSPDTDFCFLGERSKFNTPQDAATRTLTLKCGLSAVEFYGPCSSVVRWNLGFATLPLIYIPLYNFLNIVCESTGLNVMSYGTVQIFSKDLDSSIEIMFDHGKEADRFFSKMYMLDVLGRSS